MLGNIDIKYNHKNTETILYNDLGSMEVFKSENGECFLKLTANTSIRLTDQTLVEFCIYEEVKKLKSKITIQVEI